MGMAASQSRLLSLTSRMHDLEYKGQRLEAQKLQMSNKSQQVYEEYSEALNKTKLQFKQIGSDGSAQYKDASVSTLLAAGYQIKILSGSNWYNFNGSSRTDTTNTAAKWGTYDTNVSTVTCTALAAAKSAGEDVTVGTTTYKLSENAAIGATEIKGYKKNTAVATETAALANIDLTDTETLSNLVQAGFIVFEKPLSDGSFEEVNVATDTSIQEVSDEVDLKKAEAKYESDMRKINDKDKKFDTDIAALEQERNAIKTEMETLKTVAKDNVERTFKLFG